MSLYAEQLKYILVCIEGMDALDKRIDEVAGARPLYVKGPIQIVDTHGDEYAEISNPDGLGWEMATKLDGAA
jgi:hypothetical protein